MRSLLMYFVVWVFLDISIYRNMYDGKTYQIYFISGASRNQDKNKWKWAQECSGSGYWFRMNQIILKGGNYINVQTKIGGLGGTN